MVKDLLNHARVVNDGNDAHRAFTDGAAQRVNMPDAQDQVPPPFGWELERRRRRKARAVRDQIRG